MSAYVLDEVPLIEDPPVEMTPVLIDIPSLADYFFDNRYGATIYSAGSDPPFTVSTTAVAGQDLYDHWMREVPTSPFGCLILLCLQTWPFVKRFRVGHWEGAAVVVAGFREAEAHFFAYSSQWDVSLDLHLQLGAGYQATLERGLNYLKEVEIHQG